MIAMGRLAFELQQGEAEEATDPLDAGVPAFDFPVLVAAGEYDLPDFRAGSLATATRAAGADARRRAPGADGGPGGVPLAAAAFPGVIVIIGAGVCGLAAAYELSRRGQRGIVLERAEPLAAQSADWRGSSASRTGAPRCARSRWRPAPAGGAGRGSSARDDCSAPRASSPPAEPAAGVRRARGL